MELSVSNNKMRVLALGGCGEMGRFSVRTSLDFDFVDQIIIADLNAEKAKKLAQKCGPKTSFAQIDIENKKSLAELLSETDIVLNTVGPYYRFGMQVLEACMEAGCHYLDINDDWEPTLEMLELDEKARGAGVSAIIGMGVSPGVSNLLAVMAISELDQVEDVYTGWNIEEATTEPPKGGFSPDMLKAPDYQPSAAVIHGIHQFTGKITRKGAFAPEAGVDPDTFFDELAPLCEPQMSGTHDLVLVTRSWESATPDIFKS
jgi:hypothetical protein